MVISHIGFPHHIDAANVLSKNENVYSEVSGTLDECETKKEATDMLNQYAKDLERVFNYFPNVKSKIMFGTDYGGEDTPLKEIDPYINLVKKVFSKKEQDNVFYKLADKIFFQ
ncbi:amidohydrolase family protein [Patescibacteria group bacterium]|nr:amidohydrolase family protein [Patescibacteria group bacterium]